MKTYGEPWQSCLFYRILKCIDRVRLETAPRETMNLKEDQVLIVDLGGNKSAACDRSTFLGVGVPEQESGMLGDSEADVLAPGHTRRRSVLDIIHRRC